MSYPPDPIDYSVELFLNDSWQDVTNDVLNEDGITIKLGRPDQSANPAPGSCGFTLRNDSGDYSPRWPTGQWFGDIGRNTPLRVAVVLAEDTFSRTGVATWGSADSGQAWTSGGSGGVVQASDHNVSGGVGTQSVPVVDAYRYNYLGAVTHRRVDVRADMSLNFTDVTGGDVYPAGVILRGQSTSSYYLVRVGITPAEAVTIGVFLADGTTVSAPVTVSGLTHSAAQTLRVRAQAEGQTVRGKVWAASGDEPYDWHVTAHTETIADAGFVGIRSGVSSANTNALPIVFSIDTVQVKVPLYAGEVFDMPAGWDTSGNFITAGVVSGGPLERLAQGAALQSTIRRGYLRDLDFPPLIYWPCEEGTDTTLPFFTPAIGLEPFRVTSGSPEFGSLTPLDCSEALPGINLSSWSARIPQHTPGRCQVRFLVSIPSAGLGIGLRRLMVIAFAGGSVGNISVFVDQNGNASIIVYDTSLNALYNSGSVAANLNGNPSQVAVEFEQTTATNVNVNLLTLAPDAGAVNQISASGANLPLTQTTGQATALVVNPDVLLPDTVAIGHVSYHTSSQTLLELSDQLNAWKGETAANRIIRLGVEERLPVSYIGDPDSSEAMGPQRPLELLKLIYECSAVDRGELYESCGEVGLTYRTRSSLYNQTASITLDYSLGQVSPPLTAADDNRYLRNDVTVTREGGASARRALETGKLSILPPQSGGSGRYDDSTTVNVRADEQLADIAGWLLHLGTVDEPRYSVVNLDLGNRNLVNAGLQDATMDLDMGDRLVITNPKSGQAVDDISQIITGRELTLKRFIFTIKFNCVPESPYQVGVLDDTDKRLDSDTTTLTSDITSTANSFQVSISSGALWTTDASDSPIKVTIGGERMSIGAVSGTSSPQTFSSVTRSVNGVVKSHSAGDEVHVTHPFVLPL